MTWLKIQEGPRQIIRTEDKCISPGEVFKAGTLSKQVPREKTTDKKIIPLIEDIYELMPNTAGSAVSSTVNKNIGDPKNIT